MGTQRRCHCEAQSAEAIPTDGFRLLRFARNDEKESPSTDQELGLESGGRVGMKICLVCSHSGHLTEIFMYSKKHLHRGLESCQTV
jgi:hypothetical protein